MGIKFENLVENGDEVFDEEDLEQPATASMQPALIAQPEGVEPKAIDPEVLDIFEEYQNCPKDPVGAEDFLLKKYQEILPQHETKKLALSLKGAKNATKGGLDSLAKLGSLFGSAGVKEKKEPQIFLEAMGRNIDLGNEAEVKARIKEICKKIPTDPEGIQHLEDKTEVLKAFFKKTPDGKYIIEAKDPKQAEELQELIDTITPDYYESDYAEVYVKEVCAGKTRKDFSEWLNEDSNISPLEKLGNMIMGLLSKLGKWLKLKGLFTDWDFVKNAKTEPEENPFRSKELLHQIERNKNQVAWDKIPETSPQKVKLKEWKKVVKIESPEISPEEFTKRTQDPQFAPILDWAIEGDRGQISRETFDYLWEKRSSIRIELNQQTQSKELQINNKKFEGGDNWVATESSWTDKLKTEIETALEEQFVGDQKLLKDRLADEITPSTVKKEVWEKLWKDQENGTLKPGIKSLLELPDKFWGQDSKLTVEHLELLAKGISNDDFDYTGDSDFHERSVLMATAEYIVGEDGEEKYEWRTPLFGKDFPDRFEVDGTGTTTDNTYTSVKAFFAWLRKKYSQGGSLEKSE